MAIVLIGLTAGTRMDGWQNVYDRYTQQLKVDEQIADMQVLACERLHTQSYCEGNRPEYLAGAKEDEDIVPHPSLIIVLDRMLVGRDGAYDVFGGASAYA